LKRSGGDINVKLRRSHSGRNPLIIEHHPMCSYYPKRYIESSHCSFRCLAHRPSFILTLLELNCWLGTPRFRFIYFFMHEEARAAAPPAICSTSAVTINTNATTRNTSTNATTGTISTIRTTPSTSPISLLGKLLYSSEPSRGQTKGEGLQ
jgi:hypothetical protein